MLHGRPPSELAEPAPVRPGSAAAWLAAIRPASLWIAVSPVLVGVALGWQRQGAFDAGIALAALAAALLMQLATNLQNDVGYTLRGGERAGARVGLPRATARGWLSTAAVRAAIVAVALSASALGLWLTWLRGWPVLAIGAASLAAALAYMGGPRPIAYSPLGELTVFVFFGLVAVMGTDWLVTGRVGALTLPAAASVGALAAAALAINNQRDMAHDAAAGRRTFAVRFGATAGRRLFGALLALPFFVVPPLAWVALVAWTAPGMRPWLPLPGPLPLMLPLLLLPLLLPLLLAPAAWRLWRDFRRCSGGAEFTAVLMRCFRLQIGYAALLAAGALLSEAFQPAISGSA